MSTEAERLLDTIKAHPNQTVFNLAKLAGMPTRSALAWLPELVADQLVTTGRNGYGHLTYRAVA